MKGRICDPKSATALCLLLVWIVCHNVGIPSMPEFYWTSNVEVSVCSDKVSVNCGRIIQHGAHHCGRCSRLRAPALQRKKLALLYAMLKHALAVWKPCQECWSPFCHTPSITKLVVVVSLRSSFFTLLQYIKSCSRILCESVQSRLPGRGDSDYF